MTREEYENAVAEVGGDWRDEFERANATPGYDGVDVDETPDKVTITITGNALANVREMQGILNRYRGTDETAADLVWDQLICSDWWEFLGSKWCPRFAQSLPGLICQGLDEDEGRELGDAFKAAGFSVT